MAVEALDTVGLFDPSTSVFYLRNLHQAGAADLSFQYGPPGAGWIPLVGDWNDDGGDSIGLYDPQTSTFFLRNQNSSGIADIVFNFGPAGAGWTPIVGDWNAAGRDTVGLYTGDTFFLRHELSPGAADEVFGFGPAGAGWTPIAGEWEEFFNESDDIDTVGLYSGTTFFLRNEFSPGPADVVFDFGPTNSGWTPIVGDWDGDGMFTVGLYSGEQFFLRDLHSGGPADHTFGFGPAHAGWIPLAGKWTGAGEAESGGTLTLSGATFDTTAQTTTFVFIDANDNEIPLSSTSLSATHVETVLPEEIPPPFDIEAGDVRLHPRQLRLDGSTAALQIFNIPIPNDGDGPGDDDPPGNLIDIFSGSFLVEDMGGSLEPFDFDPT